MKITDQMWYAMCDVHMSEPKPLNNAGLTKPFIYERQHGVFYVPSGYHCAAMSLLLAFQHGSTDRLDIARQLDLGSPFGTSDHWLKHTEGSAFRSSVGKKIMVWTKSNLNTHEKRVFGNQVYYMDLPE